MIQRLSIVLAVSSLAFTAIVCAPGCSSGGKICDSIDARKQVLDSDTLAKCDATHSNVTLGISAAQCAQNLDGDCGGEYETYLECVRKTPTCASADGTLQPGTTSTCQTEIKAYDSCVVTKAKSDGGAGGTGSTTNATTSTGK